MKKVILVLVLFSGFLTLEAQNSTNFGIGFQLNQYQKDFGIGVTLTSPYFANDQIAVRLRGNFMFNEHLQDGEITWTPYSNITLGLIGMAKEFQNFMRLYGEGGVIALLPADEFSSEEVVLGGYGLFGFEFFILNKLNYFIEIGGIGTGAKADKIPTKPIYSNGLLISVGVRAHL